MVNTNQKTQLTDARTQRINTGILFEILTSEWRSYRAEQEQRNRQLEYPGERDRQQAARLLMEA